MKPGLIFAVMMIVKKQNGVKTYKIKQTIVKRVKTATPIQDDSLYWLGTGTSTISGGVNLVINHTSRVQ